MSSYSYLKLDKEKLLVCVGNHITQDVFLEDLELYGKFRDFLIDGLNSELLFEKKLVDLTLADSCEVLTAYELITKLSWIQSRFYALDIAWSYFDNNDDIQIIPEDKLGEYKKWKIMG